MNTRERILNTGLKMWLKDPQSVSANGIANKIGMTHATVLYHFPEGVKDAIAEYAVMKKDARIIPQLIVLDHPSVRNLAPCERIAYLTASEQQGRQ